ncbi:tyrosine-type recombinase/integrase [Acanthopleuribacter pedis]|uniref:Site-specific integrase n=1 Tax=Acanthopleuribacter pedis TaxID=442870 RepID=A0A8J7Q7L2_9BACT|nr:site-specific integrase [Acanthopleuribacter pedis]MBO1318304.1 site-specific integrase [Acanthopleuribacter pedis]
MLTPNSPSIPEPTMESFRLLAFDKKILLRQALESFVAKQKSPETARAYRREVAGFLAFAKGLGWSIEELQMVELSTLCDQVFRYLQQGLRRDPATKAPLNPKSYNRRKFALQSFFKYLRCYHGYAGLNPAEFIDKLPVHGKSNTNCLNKDEILKILRYLKSAAVDEGSTRNYLLVLCMLVFCLRRKEAATLSWSQIDEIDARITFTQKGLREKVNPISHLLLKLLLEYRNKYGKEDSYLFRPIRDRRSKESNKPVSGEFVYNLVTTTAKKVLPEKSGVTPHSFRSSFISNGLDMTDDLTRLMNASGHSSVEMLLYYDLRSKLRVNFSNEVAAWLHDEGVI